MVDDTVIKIIYDSMVLILEKKILTECNIWYDVSKDCCIERNIMSELIIKYNELTAEEFILLWESVWGDGPTIEQTKLAMEHTLFRVSVYDGQEVIAMARMIGDMGLDYYIKDVVVRPEYQHKGIGKMLINELKKFINDNGVKGTNIFVELCAAPDKIPFYEKLGFSSNDAQRLKLMYEVGFSNSKQN